MYTQYQLINFQNSTIPGFESRYPHNNNSDDNAICGSVSFSSLSGQILVIPMIIWLVYKLENKSKQVKEKQRKEMLLMVGGLWKSLQRSS